MTGRSTTSERTRRALILTGEKLFGERGIDGVSLRQVNAAAGQKNSSAAHYHFGSKKALVNAIYDYRMERVNRRRLEMLAAVKAHGREHDVRALVETLVYPIVEEIHQSDGGSHYIRFLAHMMTHSHVRLERLQASRFAVGVYEIFRLLTECLPHVPRPLIGQRFGLTWEQMIYGLADREKLSENAVARSGKPATNPAVFASNLVDTIAGGLAAPVSAPTLAELEEVDTKILQSGHQA